jgi:hypothetical protein
MLAALSIVAAVAMGVGIVTAEADASPSCDPVAAEYHLTNMLYTTQDEHDMLVQCASKQN